MNFRRILSPPLPPRERSILSKGIWGINTEGPTIEAESRSGIRNKECPRIERRRARRSFEFYERTPLLRPNQTSIVRREWPFECVGESPIPLVVKGGERKVLLTNPREEHTHTHTETVQAHHVLPLYT